MACVDRGDQGERTARPGRRRLDARPLADAALRPPAGTGFIIMIIISINSIISIGNISILSMSIIGTISIIVPGAEGGRREAGSGGAAPAGGPGRGGAAAGGGAPGPPHLGELRPLRRGGRETGRGRLYFQSLRVSRFIVSHIRFV